MAIPPSSIAHFDELYVISDLHLGGPTGFQIFNAGNQLAHLVDHLRARALASRRVALLINGDLVDFLAERPFSYFDPAGAVDKLDRIVKDPAFAPVWDALQRFANTDDCHLVINLGNHDLELALPWMRTRLVDILSDRTAKARGQITVAFDGTGFLCRVGGAEVLAVHGNEVDDWNLADYETIRRIGRDITQGLSVDSWVPNAGARLVVDVMNDIKFRFPFVDLLKPEADAVLPTLLALAPNQRDKIDAIARTAGRLLLDKVKRRIGLLGTEERREPIVGDLSQARLPSRPVARPLQDSDVFDFTDPGFARTLLDQTEDRFARDVAPLSLIDADEREEYLGTRSAVVKFFRRVETGEILREALEKLGEDRSFDLKHEDAAYRFLDQQIGDVDFLVTGHTHLERALRRKKGRGVYFNSGTWARLIRLEKNVLGDPRKFGEIYSAFKAGTMEALDSQSNLVTRRLTVVAIWAHDGSVQAELRHASLTCGEPAMSGVPGSRLDG